MPSPAVLIVEDEAIVALDLQATLHELGYDAFAVAHSAEEALAAAAARVPDLVLMDIRIKGQRDGIETAEILQSRFAVPVVYLTSHADEGTIERAKKTAPHGYLQKPVRGASLRSAIEVALYKSQLEKRDRERTRWFETTLKSIADAVVAVDVEGRVTFINDAAADLASVDVNAAVGRKVDELLRLEPARELPVLQALERRATVAHARSELVNRRDGSRRTIADTAAPVVDHGKLLGAVMVFRDVTEAEKLQRGLELTSRLASLGTLAAGVAHEVNNPLGVVVANAQQVSDQLSAVLAGPAAGAVGVGVTDLAVWRDAIADIALAGDRIGSIVADLRAFARPSPGGDGGAADPVADPARAATADVGSVVDWVTRTTRHELLSRARLVVEPIHVGRVRGDETRIGQVFVNLVINAAHAIAPGRADDNLVRIAAVEVGNDVVVSVSDTGSGMSDVVRRRIFEPFFTTKDTGTGTGLGLSICHGIITGLGGRIDVESAPGRGTTMRVTLPRATAPTSTTTTTKPLTPAPAERWRVLVIDDEPLLLRTVERVLRRHDVVTKDSGAEALDLLGRDAAFDVVICDVTMPTMNGIELYEELVRRFPRLARRTLFLSGGATTPRVAELLQKNAIRQLHKPFDVDALLRAVAETAADREEPAPAPDPLHPKP